MITVHKQRLELTTGNMKDCTLPLDTEPLCIREQHGELCFWYRLDDALIAKQEIQIVFCGTGRRAPERIDGKYLGTVLLQGGSLVVHAFWRRS